MPEPLIRRDLEPLDSLLPVMHQLHWVCDALIPADPSGLLPSAIDVGVPGRLLARALKARPDLVDPFVNALSRLPEEAPADPLSALEARDADFNLVSRLIAGSYFLDLEVNQILRYPGQEAMPYDPDYDEITEMVQRVIDRGPLFVPTPGRSSLQRAD